MSSNTPEPFLTIALAALALNVSQKTIRRLIDAEKLAVVRIGRSVRIHPKELQRYVVMHWDDGHSGPRVTN